ncbi:MAG: glycosyltransferase [Perlucidibaca sp.]
MKIVLVMAGDEEGGLEKHVVEMANGFSARGHQVAVVAHAKYAGRFSPGVRVLPVNLARGRRNLIALWQLWRALRASGAAVVHAHGSKAASMVGMLLPWLGMASVATLHSRKKQVGMFRRFQRVIAVSRISTLNLEHPGVRVIHNGIVPPAPVAQPAADAWAGLSGGPRVLAVGRLVPVKGFDVLLHAWRDVPGDLAIAGDGFEQAELEAIIAAQGLSGRVRLLGHRSDVTALMAAADLFVISSRYEGCPYTLVEALHMRLPVVSTAVGAMPEILPGQYLCPPDDAAALAGLIARTLSRPDALQDDFAPVFQLAARELTFDALLDQTGAVYQELA